MTNQNTAWIEKLDDEDISFIKRFVLSSGSLKEIAKVYGISYPTVRIRLDRLIAKIEVLEEARADHPLEQRIRTLYAEGAIDLKTMKTLLNAYREEKEREASSD